MGYRTRDTFQDFCLCYFSKNMLGKSLGYGIPALEGCVVSRVMKSDALMEHCVCDHYWCC